MRRAAGVPSSRATDGHRAVTSNLVVALIVATMIAACNTPQPTVAQSPQTSTVPSASQPAAAPCAQSGNARAGSTIRVCPPSGAVGANVTIEGSKCNSPGGPAIVYFGGPLPIDGGGAGAAAGAVELGRFAVDAAGHFSAAVQIPADLRPVQGSGGGVVNPGPYAIYSKPAEVCLVVFNVEPR